MRHRLRRYRHAFWFGFTQPGAAIRWLITNRKTWRRPT